VIVRGTKLTALLSVVATVTVLAQTASGPTYDVVSVKKNTSDTFFSSGSNERPDGSFTSLNIPVTSLIARGYPDNMPTSVDQLTGLPAWAGVRGERYDIIAKSSLSRPATAAERRAMIRALLADRFKLATHMENREQETYDLVFARGDHRLGPNIKPSKPGCEAKLAAESAATEAAHAEGKPLPPRSMPDRNGNAPSCWAWMMGLPVEGDITMDLLSSGLRLATLRPVTNKTGLTGSYRIKLTFEFGASTLRGPEVTANPDAPPTIFVAVQEQLGLKLELVKVTKETLVIDHIERPTEN
jgi:uncharacterized protein (TIGR03435 family)